jgi:hypothetical protein
MQMSQAYRGFLEPSPLTSKPAKMEFAAAPNRADFAGQPEIAQI